MKQIVELLKSIKFWITVIGLIISFIAAWPIIEEWMIGEPIVYVGEMKVEADKTIHLTYILPIEHKAEKAIVPLPIAFSNENGTAFEKFFVSFISQSKQTSDKRGWMPRLLPYNDYFAASEQKNELLHNNNVNYRDGMQTIGNVDYGIDFASKTKYENLLVLNLAGGEVTEPWDECSFKILTGAKSCDTQEYVFSVQVYYTDDVNKKKAELMEIDDKKEPYLILTPSFSRVAVNQDGLHIALYEMGHYCPVKVD